MKTPEQMQDELREARRNQPKVTWKEAAEQAKRVMKAKRKHTHYTDCVGVEGCKSTTEIIRP